MFTLRGQLHQSRNIHLHWWRITRQVALLTVPGDGKRYKLTLKLDVDSSTGQYQIAFVAPREWQTLRFVTADFAASFRGHPVAAPTVRFSDMQHLGLIISDKQSGALKINLKGIRAE